MYPRNYTVASSVVIIHDCRSHLPTFKAGFPVGKVLLRVVHM